MTAKADRPYDIVLFGATGFTGALTAEYLAAHAPSQLKWALAGRNQGKLEATRKRLGSDFAALDLLHADVTDPGSLTAVAEQARVIITTVGPYVNYGEPLVAACARAGTDYVDLTGEPEFVDRMYVAHHRTAAGTGARIVHACGFDSIPHDLGAQFTVEQLPEGVPLTLRGFVRVGGRPSGGTFHSAITAMSRARHNVEAVKARKQAEERNGDRKASNGRRVRGIRDMPRREPAVDAWAIPLPTIDPVMVLRSAKALDRYGPDFSYGHYAAVKRLPVAIGGIAGIAGMFAMAQLPPTRNFLLGRINPGDGPTPEQRAKGWFKVRFIGEGGGRRVVTEVSGGDPGYTETAKMLAESALSLAFDELPDSAGQVTTAVAMGPALRERLVKAGIQFNVLEGP